MELDAVLDDTGSHPESGRRTRRRWWILSLLVLALAATLGAVLLLTPRTGKNPVAPTADSGVGTAEVAKQTLVAQTQLNGTLGYGEGSAVVIPTGTDAATLRQAEDAVSNAQATLAADRTRLTDTRTGGRQSVTAARATASASRRDLAAALATRHRSCAAGAATPDCARAKQEVRTARDQLAHADAAVGSAKTQAAAADNQAVATVDADVDALSSARAALADAKRRATNPGMTYTAVAPVGSVIKRGERLYAVDGVTVPLFYGALTPWRALYPGASAGADVKALNNNLAALGYDDSLAGRSDFTGATRTALEAWQRSMRVKVTGVLALGDVVFRPGPVVVTAVTAAPGQAATPDGVVLTTSDTRRVVSIKLAAARQGQVDRGDEVTITLPDGTTTSGKVTSVGTIASSSDSDAGGGEDTGATIPVTVSLDDPGAARGLDQAAVLVGITTASAEDAIVVPVNALLALAGGGYAVEVVGTGDTHHLVAVELGLFDDAKGLVQVTDTELRAGQRVVVPSS